MNRRTTLLKQHSWSPDIHRDQAWLRRKENNCLGRTATSVTNDDLDELKGCIELGFGFDPADDADQKLADTFPALGLYKSVNRRYRRSLSRSSSFASSSLAASSPEDADGDVAGCGIYDRGDDPERVKARLRQWAQVVACSVRESSKISSSSLSSSSSPSPPPPP